MRLRYLALASAAVAAGLSGALVVQALQTSDRGFGAIAGVAAPCGRTPHDGALPPVTVQVTRGATTVATVAASTRTGAFDVTVRPGRYLVTSSIGVQRAVTVLLGRVAVADLEGVCL